MSMSDHALRRLTWAVAGFYAVGGIVAVVLDRASGYAGDYFFAVILLAFPVVGFVVLQKRPRNTLGWLMLAMGVPAVIPFQDYAEYALVKGLPGASVGLALSEPTWVPFIGVSGFLLLPFPDGHLPTRRCRRIRWPSGVGPLALGPAAPFAAGTCCDAP